MDASFDLDDFLPYRLNRAADAASEGFLALCRERHGVTRSEWRVIALLGRDGGLAATEIVRRSGMHKTKVSRAVAALERRRWLRRVPDESDRRVERLRLTKDGRAGLGDLVAIAREHDALLRARLGPAGLRALDAALAALTVEDQVETPAAVSEASGN